MFMCFREKLIDECILCHVVLYRECETSEDFMTSATEVMTSSYQVWSVLV